MADEMEVAPPNLGPAQLPALNLGPNAQTPAPAPAPSKGFGSRLKESLQRFAYYGGQAGMKSVGLPTDDEIQQHEAQMAHIKALTAQTQVQIQQAQQTVPVTLANGTTIMAPMALAKTLLPAQERVAGAQNIAETKANSAETIAADNNTAKLAITDKLNAARLQAAQNKLHALSGSNSGGMGALTAAEKNALVDGLIDGTLNVTSFGRMSGPQRMQLLAAAKMKDPNFDQTKFTARQGVATDFAKGTAATQVQSFRAFLGHAEDLSDFSQDFARADSKLASKPLNWLRQNASDDPKIASFLAKIDPVKKEFESFLLNNRALYESDRKTADMILSENMPAQQMQAAIKSFVHTASIRMASLNQKYKDTMGKDNPTINDAETSRILTKFGSPMRGGAAAAAPSSSVKIGTVKTFPNGKTAKWDGRGWLEQ